MYEIDYDTVEPIEVMNILKAKKDKERIDKILKLGVFIVKDGKLIIQSIKCTIQKRLYNNKELKTMKNFFPFAHQVFWFTLMDLKDLDFAISETKRIMQGEKQYVFPNGTNVQIG